MKIISMSTCESTNTEAWKYLDSKEDVIVTTENQTFGRGRHGRTWITAEHRVNPNLIFSILTRVPSEKLSLIPITAGIAVFETITEYPDSPFVDAHWNELRIKWPNDLYVSEAKAGGILCESKTRGTETADVVIGIGVNLFEHPDLKDPPSTSLLKKDLLGKISESELSALKLKVISEIGNRIKDLIVHIDAAEKIKIRWLNAAKLDRYKMTKTHDEEGKLIKLEAVDIDEFGRLIAKSGSKILKIDQPLD